MKKILETVYGGNSIQDYLIAALIILLGILVVLFLNKVVISQLKKYTEKTATKIDDYLVEAAQKNVLPILYAACIYFSLETLNVSQGLQKFIHGAWILICTVYVIKLLIAFVEIFLLNVINKQNSDSQRNKEIRGMLIIVKIVLWVLGIVFLLDNLGYNVNSVITGLGIGGIAVALAAQTILGDLFSYFVIFFDRPFEIGDFIIVGDKMGVIEKVGIKTTRIRSLSGEEIVFSNKDLTDSRIHNYKRMKVRRVVFKLSVTYNTSADLLTLIPSMIKNIIQQVEDTVFDRAHFASYGESSLDFEVVYYIQTADYNLYMDKQQAINLSIFKQFHEKGIEFAFPTRTLYVNKN